MQAKLRKFGLFSIVTMGLGFFALFFAIVYKATQLAEPETPKTVQAQVPQPAKVEMAQWVKRLVLPAGAEVLSAVPSGQVLSLTLKVGGRHVVRLHSLVDGGLLHEIVLETP